MKAIIFTSLLLLIAPNAQAAEKLARATASELMGAKDEAMAELKDLNKEFHITIRERVAADIAAPTDADGSALLSATAEVETLPGAEVAEPWILAAPDATLDVLNREDVGAFETAQLLPLNRASN